MVDFAFLHSARDQGVKDFHKGAEVVADPVLQEEAPFRFAAAMSATATATAMVAMLGFFAMMVATMVMTMAMAMTMLGFMVMAMSAMVFVRFLAPFEGRDQVLGDFPLQVEGFL